MLSKILLFVFLALGNASAMDPRIRLTLSVNERRASNESPFELVPIDSSTLILTNDRSSTLEIAGRAQTKLSVTAWVESDKNVRLTLFDATHPDAKVTQVIPFLEKKNLSIGTYSIDAVATLLQSGLNIDFAGGTLSELIEKVSQEGDSKCLNVISDKAYLGYPLPPFKLRNASAHDVAEALSYLLSTQGLVVKDSPAQEGYQPLLIIKSNKSGAGFSEFACGDLTTFLAKGKPDKNDEHKSTGDSGQKYYTVDEIVKTLTEACRFQKGKDAGDEVRFRYNPESKLLFITGEPTLVHTASVTLQSLAPVGLR